MSMLVYKLKSWGMTGVRERHRAVTLDPRF